MVNNSIDRPHWLQRSAGRDQHWDQSPWPARMAQMDSDTEQEDDDDFTLSLPRPNRSTTKVQALQIDCSVSLSNKTSTQRGSSHRHYRRKSEAQVESPLKEVISRRRHSRMESTPEPAVGQLHIDTILPLQLPPPNLCTLSPLQTYPCTWWSTSSEDNLRRSESTNSFLSASSDGSWHGDHGDEDPNGQLDQAINEMASASNNRIGSKKITADGLILSTYDYEEEADDGLWHGYTLQSHDKSSITTTDEPEAEAIRTHAGPLMNNVASFFLDVQALGLSSSLLSESKRARSATMNDHHLMRSHWDRAHLGPISSLSQLDQENNMLRHHRRHRAATAPGALVRQSNRDEASTSRLQSILQWFMPTIDDQLEHELFGYPRPSVYSRTDSIPSLSSMSTIDDSEEEDSEDDVSPFTPGQFSDRHQAGFVLSEQGHLYDINLTGKRSLVPKSSYKRRPSLVDNGTPSPLWDNQWAEEPYYRSWSSVLGLTSM